MTFIILKTMDGGDFITNTNNIHTIDTRSDSVELLVQHGAVTTSPWVSGGIQNKFSIVAARGAEQQEALKLAQEINDAEKSGALLDLRPRIFSAEGREVSLSRGFFR